MRVFPHRRLSWGGGNRLSAASGAGMAEMPAPRVHGVDRAARSWFGRGPPRMGGGGFPMPLVGHMLGRLRRLLLEGPAP